MYDYDMLELDASLSCPGRRDDSCAQWDHTVQLYVCCDSFGPYCNMELGRWITAFRRCVLCAVHDLRVYLKTDPSNVPCHLLNDYHIDHWCHVKIVTYPVTRITKCIMSWSQRFASEYCIWSKIKNMKARWLKAEPIVFYDRCLNVVCVLRPQRDWALAHGCFPSDATVGQWDMYLHHEDSGLGHAVGGVSHSEIQSR